MKTEIIKIINVIEDEKILRYIKFILMGCTKKD
jgi:hypothetical protein